MKINDRNIIAFLLGITFAYIMVMLIGIANAAPILTERGVLNAVLDGTFSSFKTSDYFSSDVELEVSASVAAAANNQTLAAAAGKRTYITGFSVTGAGATAASVITITVTGLTDTLEYKMTIPAGASVAVTPLILEFNRPIPASALNTAIVVNVPSFGAGNTAAAATAQGFQR